MEYQVIADNIGLVHCGQDEKEAGHVYEAYTVLCQSQTGRIGDSVTLLKDGEIEKEYLRVSLWEIVIRITAPPGTDVEEIKDAIPDAAEKLRAAVAGGRLSSYTAREVEL